MKQSYNIEVAGVNLNIVSSDGAEFVEKTVAELEASVQKMLIVGKNYSKLDALILCALDYLGEYHKAEAKIKNLEAQVEILEAGRRTKANPSAVNEAEKNEEADKIDKTEKTEKSADSAKNTQVKDNAASDAPAGEMAAEGESSRDAKFRQLEAFLGSQLKMDLGNK